MGSEHVCGLLRRISWRSLCDQPQEMIVAAGYLAYASLVIVLQLRGMTLVRILPCHHPSCEVNTYPSFSA